MGVRIDLVWVGVIGDSSRGFWGSRRTLQAKSPRKEVEMMKRPIAVVVCALVLGSALPAGAADSISAHLEQGQAAFWDGPPIKRSVAASYAGSLASYDCESSIQCFDYEIEVGSGAGTLRVALDSIDLDDYYYVRLFGPSGSQVSATRPLYSGEVYGSARPGTWLVRVEARRVTDGRFRMRAKFDVPKPPTAGPPRALLPNLRLLPPFKFTFQSPAYTPAGSTSGCTEDEIAEHLPTRCLRFSLGPANYGDGPLELYYQSLEGVGRKGKIFQTVHYSDGSTKEREAGEFEYHTAHGHFHHAGFGSLELFRVKDPRSGEMVRAGEGPKQGFCMAPYLIVDWRAITNDKAYTAEANCLEMTPATGSHMGLDKGWADIYEWYLSGNYVDFGINDDGLYVVRSMTDASRDILETNEKDNWGYAYIEVEGDKITVLERGYGRSPWDPNKIVAPNWLMPTV